jgi:hypothetical protein
LGFVDWNHEVWCLHEKKVRTTIWLLELERISSIENEEYPGEYQSDLEFIDDFIKAGKEVAR